MVLGDPRGSASHEIQNLTRSQLPQWLTIRKFATACMVSVDLNENVFSLSNLCRNCIYIRVGSLVGRKGEFN